MPFALWAGLTKSRVARRILLVKHESPKSGWVNALPVGESAKRSLGRLIEVDQDEAEITYYEVCADPQFVQSERAQRRYREMLRRRMRRT
jgi:hypothetical protein